MGNNYDTSMMELHETSKGKFDELLKECENAGVIDQSLYIEYDVKRGLRDSNGNGVLTGLTEISDVSGADTSDGVKVPAPGRLFYQGYEVKDLVKGLQGRRYAFEEITYLLIFGNLPTEEQFEAFKSVLTDLQELSGEFVRIVMLHNPSANIMNSLQKAILSLYSYDENPDDIDAANVLRQCLQIIGKVPLMSVYAYHAYRHFNLDKNLVIRNPKKDLSTAENILYMLRNDGKFTELEAQVLDIALVVHADHGGGNNSTFTTHVVTSTGTDTYSSTAASIASLKGPRHGGANLKVQQMFKEIKANCPDYKDKKAIKEYLSKILKKEAFDKAGLIYGMGHAVYTISDPRCEILKEYAKKLAKEKNMMEEFELYESVEKISAKLITESRRVFKPVCANVDFYSGFVYTMLGIPEELFTPIFAISRISGWSAHRLEEIINHGKIVRPAYKYVGHHRSYIPMEDR